MEQNREACILINFAIDSLGSNRCTMTFKTIPMFFILKFGDSPPSDCMLDELGINLVTFY